MTSAWESLTPGGGTPTGAALNLVRSGGWLEAPGDPNADRRRHAVVLITDGKPNDQTVCEPMGVPVRSPVEQARKLKNGETTPKAPVYVVGFQSESDGATLNDIAEAGGTDAPGSERYFVAGDEQELSDALESIAVKRVACSKQLDPAPPPGSDVAVSLGGNQLTEDGQNGFTYDGETGTVTIQGDACDRIQTNSQDGIALDIEVGCPSCRVVGGSCSADSDCCGSASCDGGTCEAQCRSIGDECSRGAQCCSGSCTMDANELVGVCTGQ
jgi:hypothetical protein